MERPRFNMRIRALLLGLLAVTAALAGCVADDAGAGDGTTNATDTSKPAETGQETRLTPEDAESFLAQAADAVRGDTGEGLSVTLRLATAKDAAPGARFDIAVADGGDRMKWHVSLHPENLPERVRSRMGMTPVNVDDADGFGIFRNGNVTAFLVGKNASVLHGAGDESGSAEGVSFPGPTGEPFDLASLLAFADGNENLTIVSYEPLRHEDRPAIKIQVRDASNPDAPLNGTLVVFTEPEPFPAYFEATVDAPEEDWDLMNLPYLRAEFSRDNVDVTFPEPVTRAMALATDAEVGVNTLTHTFRTPAGSEVAPEEIRLTVLRSSGWASFGPPSDGAEVLLTMLLSDGNATTHNVTATFTDADGDGLVSHGDTYTVTTSRDDVSAHELRPILADEVTGYRVTPGAGAILSALALAGAAALALRRR